ILASAPVHGTLTLSPNGSFVYRPSANFNGSDSFAYRAHDGAIGSNLATVTIVVAAVNDSPVALSDSFTVAEDSLLTIAAPGILSNDSDIDGDSLTAIVVSGPTHGSLTLSPNGSLSYMPAANYNGADSFTYKAS